MKNLLSLVFLGIVFSSFVPNNVLAHSGRTDSSGGHNCSSSSIAKGLCTGYHYHNSGYSAPAYIAPIATAKPSTPKPTTPKPTVKPTTIPTATVTPMATITSTITPTVTPTNSSTPEVKGIETSATPTPTPKPLTPGETAVSLSVIGAGLFGGWKFLRFLGRKAGSTNQ